MSIEKLAQDTSQLKFIMLAYRVNFKLGFHYMADGNNRTAIIVRRNGSHRELSMGFEPTAVIPGYYPFHNEYVEEWIKITVSKKIQKFKEMADAWLLEPIHD
jgi:hypothetical protein